MSLRSAARRRARPHGAGPHWARAGTPAAHALCPLPVACSMSARGALRAAPAVLVRTVRAFYDDQMTQHAAALTYYALMSLFPALLLAVSILGLAGQYPATYDAILG